MTLPKLSIAAKLYAIFALMAAITLALAIGAVLNARHHAALTDEFESANAGTWNVERVNGLIYAVVMESRGVYMSPDLKTSKVYADGILKFNARDRQGGRRTGRSRCGPARPRRSSSSPSASPSSSISAASWRASAPRSSPAAGREWGDNEANRSVRKALNKDLERLAESLCRPRQPHLCARSIPASTKRRCG